MRGEVPFKNLRADFSPLEALGQRQSPPPLPKHRDCAKFPLVEGALGVLQVRLLILTKIICVGINPISVSG